MKPGYLTTEFWMALVTNVLTQLGALDVHGSTDKTIVLVATAAAYIISRGVAKLFALFATSPALTLANPALDDPRPSAEPPVPAETQETPVAPVAAARNQVG